MTLLALLVAAALVWGSTRLTWVSATVTDDLRGTRTVALTGARWAGELSPLAVATLAAIAAVLAVRGWVLRVVAVVVVGIGVAAAIPGVRVLAGGASDGRAAGLLEVGPGQVTASAEALGGALATAGGVLCAAAGLLLLRVPTRARGLSMRYQTPAARRDAALDRVSDGSDADLAERQLWDALDAGVDPTAADAGASPSGDYPVDEPSRRQATVNRDPSTDRGDGGFVP